MIAVLLLALMVQAQDPVRVRAQLTQTEVRLGETTILRVEVETDGPRAQIQRVPSFPPGVELVSTRDFDQRQFSAPGGGRRYVTRDHVLRPSSPGRYLIPAVEVVVEGARYRTQPVQLDVMGVPGASTESSAGQHGVILRAWLDADTVYAGQQVTLQVETMFSHEARLRLRRAPEYEPPAASGFWVHDLPDRRPPAARGTRGDVYETQTFRRAFFPIAPGAYQIPPARLFYEMRRGILQAPETFSVESRPLAIVVIPLPEEGRPPAFTGAVGQLSASAVVESDRLTAGEATVLTVELRGTGNMRTLPPPSLPSIPGVEMFPPKEVSDVQINGLEIGGSKRFSWVLVPRQTGELAVPDIEYVFFDPVAREYATTTARVPPLQVEPGDAWAGPEPVTEMRSLKPRPAPESRLAWVRSPWFAGAQLVPLLLLAGALVRRRRNHHGPRMSARALARQRRAGARELSALAASAGDGFLARAEAFASQWTAARLGLDRAAVARSEALVAAGVTPGTARAFHDVTGRIAEARYAPTPPGPATCQDLAHALDRVLERIDREAKRTRQRSASHAAPGVALVLALAMASPGTAQDPASEFDAGVELFAAGRYHDAAHRFYAHVGQHRDDHAGWYNLGNAHYRAGDRGRAIWAWLHAARLHPRDADTRHNLRLARTAPELVRRAAPPVPARAEELLLVAALAWFAAAAAAIRWALLGGPAAMGFASMALALAILMAALAWRADHGPDTLVVLEPTILRAGPNLQAETLSALDPGSGLVPLSIRGAWVRARTPGGIEGWIEADLAGSLPER
jgi:hypothetical protein